jgi:dihydrofolate reductase
VSGQPEEGGAPPREAVARLPIVLVAAVAENGVIGQGGRLPWRLKSDLQYFRAVTMGKPVVMGRKTFVSIGKPLAGRTNIVISRDKDFSAPGALVAGSLDAALSAARGDALRRGADAIAIIGGTEIYRQTIGRADRLVITRVNLRPQGDAMFPEIEAGAWEEIARSEHQPGPEDAAGFTHVTYRRRTTARAGAGSG